MEQYIVDAFTDKVFKGNQAAVCVMESWPDDQLMINIAVENNFSETAFTVKNADCYELVEIVACKQDMHWLRYTGTAVFETDEKYANAIMEMIPFLKTIYNEETGHKMMCFHLENATAVDIPMMGEGESLL